MMAQPDERAWSVAGNVPDFDGVVPDLINPWSD